MSEQRLRFVIEATQPGANISQLCRSFEITRPTAYRWLERYRKCESVMELCEESRRPHHSPNKTAEEIEVRVEQLRNQFGWGAKKLQVLLHEEGTDLPVITINRILMRRKLVAQADRHGPAPKRFERAAPNDLWQMDTKGEYRLKSGWCYPLSIIDDHSRFLTGLYAMPSLATEVVWPGMQKTLEQFGLPEQMLMDHGTPWWSTTNGYGLTQFSVRLIEQGITLLYGRIAHPQTRGKVERVHRTIGERVHRLGCPNTWNDWDELMASILYEYNWIRPHEALTMKRPFQRYRNSVRPYQAQPRPWEYPSGSEVKKLNQRGCIHLDGNRRFVSESLAGRLVRVHRLTDRVLISYRHMFVREILPTGQTLALVMTAEGNGGIA